MRARTHGPLRVPHAWCQTARLPLALNVHGHDWRKVHARTHAQSRNGSSEAHPAAKARPARAASGAGTRTIRGRRAGFRV